MFLPLKRIQAWLGYLGIPVFLLVVLAVSLEVRPTILQLRYNPYALLSLTAFLANAVLLARVWGVRVRVNATYWYLFFMATLVWWSGAEFLQRLSATPEGALFWSTLASVAWICMPIPLILFTLSYVRKEHIFRNPSFVLFLALSALLFLYLDLSSDAFIPFTVDQLVLKPWGYNSGVERFFPVFLVWFESFYVVSVTLLYRHLRSVRDVRDRKQVGLFILGLLFPLILGSLSDGVLPIFGLNIYPMAVTLTTVNALIVTYAILKYGLLVFNPITIASNILETMEEALIVLSPGYVVEYANDRAEGLLGYGKEGLRGMRLKILFPAAYADLRNEVLDVLRHERFAHLEKSEVAARNGKAIPVSISAARVADEGGEVRGYILTLTDITALEASLVALKEKVGHIRRQNRDLTLLGKQLEEEKASVSRQVDDRTRELKRSRAQLMASINSLEMGFVMIDPRLDVVVMNGAVTRLLARLQLKAARHTERSSQREDTLHDIERRLGGPLGLAEAARTCLDGGHAKEIGELFVDGSYLHVYLSPIVLAHKVIGAVVLIQDITEAKLLDRSKDEFFSIASHELRTPLTAIMGYADLIKSMYVDKSADERLGRMVAGVTEGSARMLRIVQEFLNMSQLEQGKLAFRSLPLEVPVLLEEVLQELRPLAGQKGLGLSLHAVPKELPLAKGDRDRFKEVLINLVGNAIKFTEHGRVTVSVEAHPDALQIRVHDTGQGIPLKNQTLLFRKFQQAGSSLIARDASMGTGLGLYISKLLVEGTGRLDLS